MSKKYTLAEAKKILVAQELRAYPHRQVLYLEYGGGPKETWILPWPWHTQSTSEYFDKLTIKALEKIEAKTNSDAGDYQAWRYGGVVFPNGLPAMQVNYLTWRNKRWRQFFKKIGAKKQLRVPFSDKQWEAQYQAECKRLGLEPQP